MARHARRSLPPFALGLCVTLSLFSCAHGKRGCRGKNAAKCAWEKAEKGPTAQAPGPGAGPEALPAEPGDPLAPTRPDEWERATQILGAAWTMMGEGVDREALAAAAREGCAEEPATRGGESGSWTCALADAPVLAGRDFVLEVGADGVIALTAFNLGEGEASTLLDDASQRWRPLCDEDFAPYTPRGEAGEFRMCLDRRPFARPIAFHARS